MIAWLTFILFVTTFLATFEKEDDNKYRNYVFLVLGIILILTSGLREVGFDADSRNYENIFNSNSSKYEMLIEPSFTILCNIVHLFYDDIHIVFLVYAFLGVFLKFKAIKQYSTLLFLPVIIYLGNYYMLQDMTQIRAGVATGFLLLMIGPLANENRKKAALYIVLAFFFHFSSIVLIPLLLLSNKEMTKKTKYIWMMIIPIAYVMHFLHIGIGTLPIPYFQEKFEIYTEMRDRGIMGDEAIKVFNPLLMIQIAIYYYMFYMYDTVNKFDKYFNILLKIFGISIFSFLFFADLPVFAHRISELYGIVVILLFADIHYTIRQDILSRVIVCLIGIAYFSINIFYAKLFNI